MRNETNKIVFAGLFIAMGSVLAQLFHINNLGTVISPMHFPILIVGIALGWEYGLAVGILTPLLNSVLFGMPPVFPVAIGMAIELGTYGFVIGIVYKYFKPFKNNIFNIYTALIIAMVLGRVLYGFYYAFIMNVNEPFVLSAYITAVVITPLPGIVLQILTVPAIINFFEEKKLKY